MMEREQYLNVDICNPVAISKVEMLVANVALSPFHWPTSHGVSTGVDQGHLRRFGTFIVNNCLVARYVERDIRHVQKIVLKIFLDHLTLIPEANNELVYTAVSIDLHDMPNNWATTDFDHRLWPHVGFLGKTRPAPA
jgi:hypothetical protein